MLGRVKHFIEKNINIDKKYFLAKQLSSHWIPFGVRQILWEILAALCSRLTLRV